MEITLISYHIRDVLSIESIKDVSIELETYKKGRNKPLTIEQFIENIDYSDIRLTKHLALLLQEGRIEKNIYEFLLDHKSLYNQIEVYIKNNIRRYKHDILDYTCMLRELYPQAEIEYHNGMVVCHDLYVEAICDALGIHIRRS